MSGSHATPAPPTEKGAVGDLNHAFRDEVVLDDGVGYPIPDGADQLKTMSCGHIRQIFVKLSEDVGNVTVSDIGLVGVNVARPWSPDDGERQQQRNG